MEILKNVSLKKYTTLKIGGIAENFYIPKSSEDLQRILKENKEILILGAGSNLLINDEKKFEHIVYMGEFEDKILKELEEDRFYVSSSVKLQKLINIINEKGFGGIEYLYSVPATVGGAVIMNAGRGKQYNKQISDYIVEVKVLENGVEKLIKKEDCDFSYRMSKFKKNKDYIILGAVFKFEKQEIEVSNKLKKERLETSKQYLDAANFSAGSVFKKSNGKILRVLRLISPGWKKGVKFSKKTNNWLNNHGEGTYKQAKMLINLTKCLHRLLFQKIELEYIIWD